jgi:hypothetical protein
MIFSGSGTKRFAALSAGLAPVLALGGCFAGPTAPDLAAGVQTPTATTAALVAAPSTTFTPKTGSVSSTGLVARTVVSPVQTLPPGTPGVAFTVFNSASSVQTFMSADTNAVGALSTQKVTMSATGHSGTGQMSGLIESNGGDLYRGSASGSGGDYIYYTNTPTKALNDSLGATALSYSYIGLGGLAARAAGSAGAMESHAVTLFGGDKTKTTDMPTTGSADYKGAFVGVEQDWRGGTAPVVSSRLNGAVDMKADFAAATVTGRVGEISRSTPGGNGFEQKATDYSIGFNGKIDGASFAGTAGLTQWGTNTPIEHTLQSGVVQGGFFGPKASEAAGAIAVSSAHDATKTLVTGSFGAKKQ